MKVNSVVGNINIAFAFKVVREMFWDWDVFQLIESSAFVGVVLPRKLCRESMHAMVSTQSNPNFRCHQSSLLECFGNVKENLIVDLLDGKMGLRSLKKMEKCVAFKRKKAKILANHFQNLDVIFLWVCILLFLWHHLIYWACWLFPLKKDSF